MFPLLLLGAVLAYAMTQKPATTGATSAPESPKSPKGTGLVIEPACIDAGMPPEMAKNTKDLLANATDTVILRAAAEVLTLAHFPLASQCLKDKADRLARGSATGRREPPTWAEQAAQAAENAAKAIEPYIPEPIFYAQNRSR